MLSRKEYARIHILLKEYGIDDEVYRTILWGNFGVGSSKELNYKQYQELLKIIKNTFKKNLNREKLITEKQIEYLKKLLNKYGIIYNKEKYISQILHKEIYNIYEVNKKEAGKLIRIIKDRIKSKEK
ncbi:MAG: phage protein GemA/Gp16 family protein [Candidatus Pacearchaeota archaeon]